MLPGKDLTLLKVGGGEVDSPEFLASLTRLVSGRLGKLVILHGGGKDIGRLLEALGVQSAFHEGLRITGDTAIEAVEMALSGLVNKRIVGALVSGGVKAIGLSGRDLGLILAHKLEADVDLGHVGEPLRVDPLPLHTLLEAGYLPVISPVSQDEKGTVFNINADHAARAVAVALGARDLVFLSNVPGVYDDIHQIGELKPQMAESLIRSGVIDGGMIPKVRSAVEALNAGVKRALISDLAGLENFLAGKPAATIVTK